ASDRGFAALPMGVHRERPPLLGRGARPGSLDARRIESPVGGRGPGDHPRLSRACEGLSRSRRTGVHAGQVLPAFSGLLPVLPAAPPGVAGAAGVDRASPALAAQLADRQATIAAPSNNRLTSSAFRSAHGFWSVV